MSVLVRSARSLVVMTVVVVAAVVAAVVPVGLMVGGGSPAGASAPVPGETWTKRTAAEANVWRSVTYGNGLFVAVASFGTNQVMTSPDGITWTARAAAEANSWYSVTYGNGVFVAVATSGTNRVMTSTDGVTWTARAAAEANSWVSVTYGNGVFVAVATSGTNRVMTSTDGITWTARTAAEANNWWTSVTYGNGLFVAVASFGTNQVMTSPDGVTWTARSAAEANSWVSVTYGNGLFVAVATNGTNRVMTSPDGTTWTARAATEAIGWNSVTYGDGVFLAVGTFGTNQVMTSTDGVTWTARAAAEANNWRSVTYGNGLFVAVASSGTNRVMTSGALTTTPDAPTSLSATPGDGSGSISFTAGADGGASISNYEYQLDSGSWTALSPADTTSPVTIPGLTNGTTYSVKLRAVNTAGSGAASSAVSVTPRTVPGAPTISSVTAGDSTVSVAFSPGSTGGSSITDYEYQLDGSGSWFSMGTTSSPVSISVTNGVTYTVKLRAVNVAGSGAASDASASFTPATTPGAPTSLAATSGDGSVSIAFTAGADGGASISKYQYSLDGGTSWLDATGTSSPITIGGLTNYTAYSVLVRAVNSAGAGAPSAAVSVMAELAGPTPCAATSLGKRQIRACWLLLTPSTGWVTRYRAVVFASGTSTRVGTCQGDPTETSCVIRQSGLAPNTTYDIRVRARIKTAPKMVFWSSFTPIVQVTTDP